MNKHNSAHLGGMAWIIASPMKLCPGKGGYRPQVAPGTLLRLKFTFALIQLWIVQYILESVYLNRVLFFH
jgi:hypothetical protein